MNLVEEKKQVREVIDDLIRACGSGMNWMDQVDRVRLSSATRGILHVDIGMTSSAIYKAKQFLATLDPPF